MARRKRTPLKKIDYSIYPDNQTYRVELPNGQRMIDHIERLVFAVHKDAGYDKDFTKKELERRGMGWVFEQSFAVPTDKNGKDI